MCRDHKIKGYSAEDKSGLVELVLDSLSEEELKEVVKNYDRKLIPKGIKNLTPEEEQWLRTRAEESESFESLLNSSKIKGYLSSFQRHRIRNEMAKEINDGDIELEEEELEFLKNNSNIDSKLEEMLEIYETYECFTQYEYRKFTKLSLKCSRRIEEQEREPIEPESINNENIKKSTRKDNIFHFNENSEEMFYQWARNPVCPFHKKYESFDDKKVIPTQCRGIYEDCEQFKEKDVLNYRKTLDFKI